MQNEAPDQLLTLDQACELLGCPRRTLYYWINCGYVSPEPIPPYYQKPRRYIRRAELDRFMREGRRPAQIAENRAEYDARATA